MWAPRGVKVVQKVALTRAWRYLALVVTPLRGALVWTWAENMRKERVAQSVQTWQAQGVAAVVGDRASSHRSHLVRDLGVPLIEQPPYAPECNPAARIFEELRRAVDGVLYPDLDAKIAAVEQGLTALAADPARLKRLVDWSWIQTAVADLPVNTASP